MQNACKFNHCRLTVTGFTLHLPLRRMRRAFGFFSSILRLPADGDGRDSPGAGGDGGGAGKPGGDDAAKTGITESQANDLITRAINARFKTFEANQAKSQEAAQAKLLETIGATLEEKFAAFKPTGPDDDKGKSKPTATDLTQNPEFRAQAKQLADLKAELQAEREEKAKATAAARNEALHRKVEAELTALGIADPAAVRKLLHADNIVGYEDDATDTVVFKDEEGGALPLKRGLESWAKSSPLAKRFMPATGADGSGEHREQGGQRKVGSTGEPPKQSRAQLGQLIVRAAQGA